MFLDGVEGNVVFAAVDVAVGAVRIRDTVADLARQQLGPVDLMLRDAGVWPDLIFVARLAGGALRAVIAVADFRQPVLAMKLRAGVAIGARHAALAQMHVAGDAFVQPVVLVLDAAAVAGGTGPAHRRGANDSMPFEQSATNRVRLADVAVAA